MLPELLPVVLVHGGLYENTTSAEFWGDTGVTTALGATNTEFIAPQRPAKPASWDEERRSLSEAIDAAGFERVALVGASNGCSAAARLAIDEPDRVARLMLAWPATANDESLDGLARIIITDEMGSDVADALLQGETLRGVTDDELAQLQIPLVVFPSLPENHAHQRQTVMGLLAAQPNGFLVGGSPEPPHAQFAEHLDTFITMVTEFARVEHDD